MHIEIQMCGNVFNIKGSYLCQVVFILQALQSHLAFLKKQIKVLGTVEGLHYKVTNIFVPVVIAGSHSFLDLVGSCYIAVAKMLVVVIMLSKAF